MTQSVRHIWWAFLGGIFLGLSACAPSVSLQEDPEDYREEVARLQREIAEDPDEAAPLRDLGVIYVRTQRSAEGYEYLQQAYARDQDDPKILFFLGLAAEKVGKRQAAIQLFERFPDVPSDSPYRRLMEGRYEWLTRLVVRENIREMLAREETLSDREVSPRIVAVLPFVYQGDNERYAPLSRGLSEMLSVDLANIERLRLVERTRLQALLDELEIAQSDFVDPSSAPQVGRILGAGRLVGGSYNVLAGDELRIEAALASIEERMQAPDFEARSGPLADLFALQKELVFRVIDGLGVELTAEEQAAIQEVPTENLQAFLAYSRGLEAEDGGNFDAAARAYQRAQSLDPGFQRAAQRAEQAAGLSAAAGPTDTALLTALRVEGPAAEVDLLDLRLRNMMDNLGYGVPVPDDRQPAAERSTALEGATLSDPPNPPARGGN
ncbi:MAG: tetratricopeptide repeat protein [Bacteroidetes bacterium]|jgi:TolB-like protein|nr:tetratricopeptide repeat protein [Bacteroidota bacterium]